MTVAPADTVTFLLTPLREGRRLPCGQTRRPAYFYSRPCGRGDTPSLTSPSTVILFLLTPLREGRRKRPTQNPYPSRFLLTPLREGRLAAVCAKFPRYSISTHAPAGGATEQQHVCGSDVLFLLTPLREGRPGSGSMTCMYESISTHAPAGGATTPITRRRSANHISTHAPAGGATRNCQCYPC